MKIYFLEAEPLECAFFEASFAEHEVECVDAPDEVGADAVLLSIFIYTQINVAFLDAHPALRFIATRSTATDHLPLETLRARGIVVSSVPAGGETTVAEHTFALILALSRRLREVMAFSQSKARFSYEQTRGFELSGKTLGIIGMGHIGQRVVALAHAFEMRVLAYDVETPAELAQSLDFAFVPLPELLAQADVISLHATLSPRTYHLMNREAFACCKRGVLLINTARGALIDTEALREALDSGVIGGAGLDVLQDERVLRANAAHIIAGDIVKHLRSDAAAPETHDAERVRELQEIMLGDAVLKRTNVVFTPHVAANSNEAVARRNQHTVANIAAFLAGEPINCVP